MVSKLNATHLAQNSSWCHVAVEKYHNHTESNIVYMRSCERSESYVQNWKYFRFVVAFL